MINNGKWLVALRSTFSSLSDLYRVVPRRTASRRNYNLERDVRLRLHGKHRPRYTTVETRNQL